MRIIVKTVWRTKKDTEVCPTCKALEGYTWTFDAGEAYPTHLIHPVFGPVYDMRPASEGSLIEEEKGHQCRCRLEHQLEASSACLNEKMLVKTGNKK
ncbi:MAG: hypothetical protein ACQCN5_07220 [Candidatus Bathyarchaeia archaeon]|jgi:hypothetical protein